MKAPMKGVNRQDAKAAEGLRVEPSTELDDLAHCVIGAAIEVHRLLGPGFLESGEKVGEARLDLLVDESLLVELKAVEGVAPIHVAQVLSYLKATRLRLGLLITFNVTLLQRGIKRVVYTH